MGGLRFGREFLEGGGERDPFVSQTLSTFRLFDSGSAETFDQNALPDF